MKSIDFLMIVFDLIIPRFLSEDVALIKIGPGTDLAAYEIACSMNDVQPGEIFDGIAEVDSFTWLGIGITYRIGNFRIFESDTGSSANDHLAR